MPTKPLFGLLLTMTNPQTKNPGVRGLAKATGLSVATISRVLNNSDQVNVKTRERVLAAMRETGYVMNSAARALATNRTKTIGAVVPTLAYSIFARFLDAVERALAEHGYALVIASTDGDLGVEEKRTRELLDMGAEGIILSGAIHDKTLLQLLESRSIPAVCTSVCRTRNALPAIGYDNTLIGQMAISYLADLGHRSVGVIHGPLADNDRTRLRVSGVTREARRAEVQTDFRETVLEVAGGVEAAADLFAQAEPPTAILCLSDILALGTLFESGRAGLAVPDDVSIMGCDDLDWAAHCHPPLTTVRLPTARMGQMVAVSLVERLDRAANIEDRAIEAAIVERSSTRQI